MRFLVLFLFPLFLFSDVASEKDTLADSLFTANDAIVTPGTCLFSCRAVADGYVTQIIDIDAKSGTTHCEVYSINDTSKALGVNANQQNLTCKAQATKNPSDYQGQLKSNSDTNYQLIGAKYETDSMTFSRFLTGMATLDPDIVDFSATNSTGILQVKSPSMLYGTNISNTRQETFLSFFGVEDATTNSEIVSSVDSLNKANLGYFSNLFSNMSSIYSYLQNLLFVFVSGFFVVLLGTKKLQAYLAKENDNTNYLSKLYVPIIAVALFYIPVPSSDNNMHSSIMQNIIRNFMATSTQVADKAAIIGANTYLQKLYSSVGANTMQGEATIYALRDSAKAQRDLYANIMQQCKSRFPDAMTFQVKDTELDQQSIYNFNKVQEGITAKACRSIERKWLIASKTYDQQSKYADQIAQSFGNNALQSKLNSINTFLNNRETELGWINAAFIPSAAILIEMMPLVTVAKSTITEDQESNQQKIRDAYASGDEEKSLLEKIKTTGGSIFGAVMAKMVYAILPGVNTIFQVFNSIIGSGVEMITFIATFFSPIGGAKAFNFITHGGGSATIQLASLVLAAMFVGLILKYIPLITSMIAGILAVVGWLFELTQYFFITPFVVAYAVTMRKTDKISEYLVTGIVIFFKPVLLVIFIYLGLFLYYLCMDVFVMFAEEQFYLLDAINQSFFVAMVLQLSLGLIKIVSSFAAVYLMWKVILSAPSHVIKMIGLNNVGDFLEPISSKLERQSLV